MRAIFATRFLDAISQQLSSQHSNKRSSARRRVSDEFPVSASHSHSPLQQVLPLPYVLCHRFNNNIVDGSYSCSAACVVCVKGKRLLMSSTILCSDGKWVIWVSSVFFFLNNFFLILFKFWNLLKKKRKKEPKQHHFDSINSKT